MSNSWGPDGYVPSEKQIRWAYARLARAGVRRIELENQFDRWLAAHDNEVRAEGRRAGWAAYHDAESQPYEERYGVADD